MKTSKQEYLTKLEEINNDGDLGGSDYVEAVLDATCEADLTTQERGLAFTHLVYYMFPNCDCPYSSDISLSDLIEKLQ